MKEPRLTPFQEKFCILYVQTSNATQSYKDAYGNPNDGTARRSSCDLLKLDRVKKEIKRLQRQAMKKFKVKTEDLIRLNVEIAFSNLSDVLEITESGDVQVKPDGDIDSLDGISYSKSTSSNKDGESTSISISAKRPDRVKAAQELARLIGAYDNKGDDKDSKKDAATRLLESLARFKNNKK